MVYIWSSNLLFIHVIQSRSSTYHRWKWSNNNKKKKPAKTKTPTKHIQTFIRSFNVNNHADNVCHLYNLVTRKLPRTGPCDSVARQQHTKPTDKTIYVAHTKKKKVKKKNDSQKCTKCWHEMPRQQTHIASIQFQPCSNTGAIYTHFVHSNSARYIQMTKMVSNNEINITKQFRLYNIYIIISLSLLSFIHNAFCFLFSIQTNTNAHKNILN